MAPRITVAVLLAGAVLLPRIDEAALGEPASSVAADQSRLSARRRAALQRERYSIEQLSSSANTVREFVGPAGTVFAVAWSGRMHPDLAPLLGRFAAEYEAAARAQPRARGARRRRVESAHVVVETWGHMRDLHGRAYVVELLPPGVTPDEIR